jgi:photosystem II stability/assembly factor-like uncharacterized protein
MKRFHVYKIKNILAIAIILNFYMILGLNNSYSQSAWQWQNPQPQGFDLTGVHFVNKNFGVAVGYAGTILNTTNGGESWSLQKSGSEDQFVFDVFFNDENNGTAVGISFGGNNEGTILRTSDGGHRWYVQRNDIDDVLRRVVFINKDLGFIMGGFGKILKTLDGGNTWITIKDTINIVLEDIAFVDSDTGVAVGGAGIIYRTTDSGNSWSVKRTLGSHIFLNGVSFLDDKIVIAVGYEASSRGGILFRSTDAGNSWSSSQSFEYGLNKICSFNQSTAIVVGDSGIILKTTDSEISWNVQINPVKKRLTDVSFSNITDGIIVGFNGTILTTKDAGLSWTSNFCLTTGMLSSVFFTDINNGYIVGVGSNGIILKTSNGGKTWECKRIETIQKLTSIKFLNANIGIAVSWDGIIVRTSDAGLTWISESSGTKSYLKDVFFINKDNIIIVGDSGTILRSTNGGSSWTKQNSGTTRNLKSVCFTDINNGIIIGYRSTLLRTSNGGETWYPITINNRVELYDVTFYTVNKGIAVGGGGSGGRVIMLTTDKGESWSLHESVGTPLFGVSFADSTTGIAIGYSFSITKTTDGGLNWISLIEDAATQIDLNDVFMINASTGTIVGSGGTILRTTTGGVELSRGYERDEIFPKYQLSQNYPNPFNPTTTIEYQIPNFEYISLRIFDILGREIKTLVNEYQAPGNYKIFFDANSTALKLSSGVYYYRLQAGNNIETKRMLLLK